MVEAATGADEAVRTLRRGLGDIVARELHAAMVAKRLSEDELLSELDDDDLAAVSMSRWPLPVLARMLVALWDVAFAGPLGEVGRAAAQELAACVPPLSRQEAPDAAVTAGVLAAGARLLVAAGAPEASEVIAAHAALVETLPDPSAGCSPDASAEPTVGDRSRRIVMWMKREEAQLVADAYRLRRGATGRTAGDRVIEVIWFAEGDAEAERYRANVCLLRHRGRDRRPRALWIREEEAGAVLLAYDQRADVEFEHVKHGLGGRVDYHPDGCDLVQRYRANAMLSRYRNSGPAPGRRSTPPTPSDPTDGMRCPHCGNVEVDLPRPGSGPGGAWDFCGTTATPPPGITGPAEPPAPRIIHLPSGDPPEAWYGRWRWVGEEWALFAKEAAAAGADVHGMDADGSAAWLREIAEELGDDAVLLTWREEPEPLPDDE